MILDVEGNFWQLHLEVSTHTITLKHQFAKKHTSLANLPHHNPSRQDQADRRG